MRKRKKVNIVRFDQVGLCYPKNRWVFHNLNFSLNTGEFYFLTGSSGVGKSSLLKLIYRDISATQGTVRVFGRNVETIRNHELPLFRQRMGLVFQNGRLLDHISTIDNVALGLRVMGNGWKKSRKQAAELLDWVGLGDHMDALPPTLSDGQRQRTAIARAVISRPLMLLADEPCGNVDEETSYKIMPLFEELSNKGTLVIYATHNRRLLSHFKYPELYIESGQLIVGNNFEQKTYKFGT